ncbi:MAG TPA: DUF4352 domain-containing protein [Candidatus Dojkabacteria bacterium]|nr:DUF4352 domain-containing protein [Candidatus Dojkabacteria bacterium]
MSNIKRFFPVLILLSIFSLTSIACSSGSRDIDTGRTSDNTTTETEDNVKKDEEKKVEPVVYKQSDTVEIDGKKISILEVKTHTSSNQFMKPKDGNRFLAVKVTEENVSNEGVSYNAWNYKLVDTDGLTYSQGFADIDNQLSAGDLQPTRKATGWLVFEVPKDKSNSEFEFIYEPFSFDSKQVVWALD